MDKKLLVYLIVFLGLITAGYFFIAKIEEEKVEQKPVTGADFTVGGKPPSEKPKTAPAPKVPEKKIADLALEVPYVNEAPQGIFTGPWKNACEEASIAMAEGYYLGKKQLQIRKPKNL